MASPQTHRHAPSQTRLQALPKKTTIHKSTPGFPTLLLALLIFFLLLAIFFSVALIILFQMYSALLEEKNTLNQLNHAKLHCVKNHSSVEGDFITNTLNPRAAYYVGLSDPEGLGQWQWVDQTPYDQNATILALRRTQWQHAIVCCAKLQSTR
ncbi:C-type lectin domain family 4, member a1 [Apodemus speciosus]|uniref:C-type lectin domain family 4, member a1 n=1 Tax=Apodemus speciosus TaxID=105296 RepID=A0ABQ0EWC7_APOSI